MLDSFLETNIQNKAKILSILHSNTTISHKKLCSVVHLSPQSTFLLIDELNSDITGLGEIKRSTEYFSFVSSESTNFFRLFQAICVKSSILHCLKFMILNDTNKPFSLFIEEAYLTKSSGYRIRQNCCEYLHRIGLDMKNNYVIGDEYRIRFLIALLHYKYGVDCYEMDGESLQMIRKFILSTNKVIDLLYIEQTEHEYGYFEYLVMLSWKRFKYPISPFCSKQLERLKTIFIYGEMKQALKNILESALQIEFSENDYDYLYLVYCCTNNCLFADKWTQDDIALVHNLVFSDRTFNDLLQRLASLFPQKIIASHAFRSTLIYFYKKCLMQLQCIIPDKNFFVITKKDSLTTLLIQQLANLLNTWRKANGIKYEIDHSHLFYLSIQMVFILRQFIPPIPVLILSDLNAELEVMQLYFTRNFSSQKITIHPLLLNAQQKDILFSAKNSVIIVHQKFKSIIHSLGLKKCNTVVLITVEITENEINMIRNAIADYEKIAFLEFINVH